MRFSIALLSLTMLFVGCKDSRPSRVPVSGQVLIDGKPLTFGFVQFVPQNDRASRAKLDQQGRFILSCYGKNDGAVIGKHTVVIIAGEPIEGGSTLWHAPKKYTNTLTSGVTQEITEPTNNVVIDISWQSGKPFVEKEDGSVQPVPESPKK